MNARLATLLAATLFVPALLPACAAAQDNPPVGGDEKPPVTTTTTTTGAADNKDEAPAVLPPLEPALREILVKMDEAGDGLQTLTSNIRTIETDYDTMADTQRVGLLRMDRSGDTTRFLVTFRGRVAANGGVSPNPIHYLLEGDELIEVNEPSRTKITRKLPPEQANRDLLKLGEGPFPMPIGQSPEEVQKQFDVSLVDPASVSVDDGDIEIAEGATRIRLVPKAGTGLAEDFSWVLVDVDPETGLPKQVVTLDEAGVNEQATQLLGLKVNEPLDDTAFTLPPTDETWTVTYEAL